MREIKAILPDTLHTNGPIAKAPACENTRDPLERSSSGFINTTSILEKAEHSRIDNTDGDNDEYIKDDHFSNNAPMSVEKDREKSEHLSAMIEDDHNVHQSKDVNKYRITKVWASVEVSDSVSMSRDQEPINKIEGSEIDATETCRKIEPIRSRKNSREIEWEGDNDNGKKDNYYDSHNNTNA